MSKKQAKKITLEKLSQEMRDGFVAVGTKIKESEKRIVGGIDAKIDSKIDELAAITKKGFDNVDERFNKLEGRFDRFEQTNSREHEEMNLRLNEVAYRFELLALQKRVEKLERMTGIVKK